MAVEVLLIDHVEGLGIEGDIVKVSDGYARNFLFPKGYASEVTEGLKRKVENKRILRIEKLEKDKITSQELANKLSELEVKIQVKIGENGKMFGSVGVPQIKSYLLNEGIDIEKSRFKLHNPISNLGSFDIAVNLHPEVEAIFKLIIVEEK